MSFWDLAQTAATIAAGVYGGPAAGAAVGGGLSAIRGKDVIMGTVGGYLGGMGGGGMNAAANQTALTAGTNVATVNAANAAASGLTGTTGATMTGFGGAGGFGTAAANTGINALPTANNFGNFGNVRNIDTTIGGANLTGPGGNFSSSSMPIKTPISTSLQGGANPNANFGSVQGNLTAGGEQIGANYPNYTKPIDSFAGANTGLQNTEIGANLNNPNTNFAKGENYKFIDQSTQMPDGGFSMSEKFDAVVDNPRDFMKNLGGGNELYGAGKLGLTGLGLVSSAMEPEDPYGYGKMEIPGNDVRNRGPQGQLNLNGLPSLNLDNPYGYAEGGYLSGGNVPGDGMSDSIPAMIGRGQQAALSEGEFVVPADVVSHLGNGSSNAGSKQLYAMMDQVRKDRTGTEKQGKQINPERYMPA
jgi:hypothetical protein